MYYRLHVAVMKHLLRISTPETKDDMTLFDRYVTEATESPFAQRKEKHYEMWVCKSGLICVWLDRGRLDFCLSVVVGEDTDIQSLGSREKLY